MDRPDVEVSRQLRPLRTSGPLGNLFIPCTYGIMTLEVGKVRRTPLRGRFEDATIGELVKRDLGMVTSELMFREVELDSKAFRLSKGRLDYTRTQISKRSTPSTLPQMVPKFTKLW